MSCWPVCYIRYNCVAADDSMGVFLVLWCTMRVLVNEAMLWQPDDTVHVLYIACLMCVGRMEVCCLCDNSVSPEFSYNPIKQPAK